jgi:hypothetical protein
MKTEPYCVYIAEPDGIFRKKLKKFFAMVEPGIKFNFEEPQTVEEIEAVYRLTKPDIVFIDAMYLLDGSNRITRMLKQKKHKYQLIVIISDQQGHKVKDLVDEIDHARHPYLCGSVPKDNFSRELFSILISFFILKSKE